MNSTTDKVGQWFASGMVHKLLFLLNSMAEELHARSGAEIGLLSLLTHYFPGYFIRRLSVCTRHRRYLLHEQASIV